MRSIEASGKTVKDAIRNGLAELGCDSDDVDIQVIEMGSPGLFGMFGKPAKVRLTVKADDPALEIEMPVLSLDAVGGRKPRQEKRKQEKRKQEKPAPKVEKPVEKAAEKIVENSLSELSEFEEAMILFHDLSNKTSTVEALPEIIEALQESDIPIAVIDDTTMTIQHYINTKSK